MGKLNHIITEQVTFLIIISVENIILLNIIVEANILFRIFS